jgi:6-phosphogluconolactonase (cycloisomerase 2 family)
MKAFGIAKNLGIRLFLIAVFLAPLIGGFATPVAADDDDGGKGSQRSPGAVYTMTNAAAGNEVIAYDRAGDGSLTFRAAYATDGLGTGMGLGSQGSIILSQDGQWLFVVNAGSNEISVFQNKKNELERTDVVDSGGVAPISLTVFGGVLYVLNAGDTSTAGNITGFTLEGGGTLAPLANSTQPLSSDAPGATIGPAQVAFDNQGEFLVVTEKMTNMIDTYAVDDGLAGPPETHPSAGETPFGFAFDRRNHPIVSEAFGGAPNASATSSYDLEEGDLEVISASVPTTQTAACWVAISKDGKYAYAANTGSGSVSSYAIAKNGEITLLEAQAGVTGGAAIDLAVSNNGRYLFALAGRVNTISVFHVEADGSLELLSDVSVPAGSVGLAAR